jgi:hypothetical protein
VNYEPPWKCLNPGDLVHVRLNIERPKKEFDAAYDGIMWKDGQKPRLVLSWEDHTSLDYELDWIEELTVVDAGGGWRHFEHSSRPQPTEEPE